MLVSNLQLNLETRGTCPGGLGVLLARQGTQVSPSPFLLRNSDSALQVLASTSTLLSLTNGQGLAATSEFCFSTIILFIGLFPGPSLGWGCVSRQNPVCEAQETRALAPGDAHHPASSLDLAQPAATFHQCECRWRAPAAGAHAALLLSKEFKNQGKMRAGDLGLPYTPLAVLLPWPGSPASPARGF